MPDDAQKDTPEVVYVDGACSDNQNADKAVAGIGVFFGVGDARNTAAPLLGAPQTNNRAEMTAAIVGIQKSNKLRALQVYTDSNIVYMGITQWIKKWRVNGWRSSSGAVANADLWRDLDDAVRFRARTVTFHKVKGHSGVFGNEQADALATAAVRQAQRRIAVTGIK